MSLTVIKLGGSLLNSTELPLWLESIVSISRHSNVVIVPGGGVFAEQVRKMQTTYRFDDRHAHCMALLAMAQYGHLLASINPSIRVISDFDDSAFTSGNKFPLLWLPLALMNDFSEITPSWDFTSDSIALWFARRAGADRLVLVKSRFIPELQKTFDKLIENGLLDKGFQKLISGYKGNILWFDKSQYLELQTILVPDELSKESIIL
ncbi:MAG: hypothetical protein MI865_03835 [Proteobacteria bacterium]|nr:hypothetical protein [Pseudomonadota bacterium]